MSRRPIPPLPPAKRTFAKSSFIGYDDFDIGGGLEFGHHVAIHLRVGDDGMDLVQYGHLVEALAQEFGMIGEDDHFRAQFDDRLDNGGLFDVLAVDVVV